MLTYRWLTPEFQNQYPLSVKLGLEPVETVSGSHPGFDSLEVARILGAVRYAALASKIEAVFCCGHATYPPNHPDKALIGMERHCIYADDLEAFLKAGG